MLTLSPPLTGAESIHLLGFVDKLCQQEPHCFELLVKPDFVALTGERVIVHFTESTRIYDPENYELNMAQQNIVAGSHLRLLLEAVTNDLPGTYHATFIWIGD